jgi:predicted nucleic acid-binding protein
MNLADTNVVVSLLLPLRGEQHREALACARAHGPLAVGEAILAETCWVLERRYRLKRTDVAALLREAFEAEDLTAWDPVLVERALALMERMPRLSIVDCILAVRVSNGDRVFTFDRRLEKALEQL